MTALQKQVDNKYCQILLNMIRNESTTRERTHETSMTLLALEPFTSEDDIVNKMDFFSQKYPEYKEMHTYVQVTISEEKSRSVIEQMSHYLKQNNVDAALAIAQQTL